MKNKFTPILISGTKTLIYDSNIFINQKYDPNKEPNLEHIMRSLGYPLPSFHAKQ